MRKGAFYRLGLTEKRTLVVTTSTLRAASGCSVGIHAPEVACYQKAMSSGPIFVSLSFSKRRARPCSGSRR